MVRAIAFSWRQAWRQTIGMIIALLLAGLLTACGGDRPPQSAIEQALQLQVDQTQQQLRQQFRSVDSVATVERVKVKKQQSQAIESVKGYRIEGTYSLSIAKRSRNGINSPQQHITRRQNPFELYLQQTDEETWSLARPLADGHWKIYPLAIEPSTPDT
ncbi:hypothetical protein H6F67_09520 [Microcoleus sp. FACHB-1515]|uniref:hypothetical protein n=1 Tax=Cyanophyceae TaxID=3028117 RepID=UPI001685532E|nr:hypothetical protein [Microcoleus sp. FACHB-1515]MBD2090090.1 hypothetical protein [Microcoleus sp. FACHB-1515]